MSGNSAQQAPQGYQPTNQGGADQGFQAGVGALNTGASALQNQVVPQYAGITSSVANNPYYNTAQQYAGLTSGLASGTVAPQQFSGAAAQQQTGDAMTGLANTINGQNASGIGMGVLNNDMSQSSAIGNSGYLQQAQALLSGDLSQAGAIGNSGYLQQAQGLLGTSEAAGNAILNTGFDPQHALYNQQYQQQLDQQNAINSMNGVAGSPYGAGVSGQEANNFNLNWQNNLLNREATAASAYDGLINTGVGAYSGVMGAATGAQSTLQGAGTSGYGNIVNTATGAQSTLQGAGTGAYSGLTGAQVNAMTQLGAGAGSAYNNASGLNTQGLQTLSTAGQVQNQTYLQQKQAELDALNAQVGGTNSAYGLTQQGVTDQGNYLNIGQSATQNAQNAVGANNATNQQANAGIGQALGSVAHQIAKMIPW